MLSCLIKLGIGIYKVHPLSEALGLKNRRDFCSTFLKVD
jgi:hypothetical protein